MSRSSAAGSRARPRGTRWRSRSSPAALGMPAGGHICNVADRFDSKHSIKTSWRAIKARTHGPGRDSHWWMPTHFQTIIGIAPACTSNAIQFHHWHLCCTTVSCSNAWQTSSRLHTISWQPQPALDCVSLSVYPAHLERLVKPVGGWPQTPALFMLY